MKRLLTSVLDPEAPGSAERWQAIFAMVWATWLLLPFDSFLVSAAYADLRTLAPEWAWGALALLAGLLAFVASYNGPALRVGMNLWMALGWGYVAAAVLHSIPPSTIGALLAVLFARQLTLLWSAILDWRAKQWTTSLKP